MLLLRFADPPTQEADLQVEYVKECRDAVEFPAD